MLLSDHWETAFTDGLPARDSIRLHRHRRGRGPSRVRHHGRGPIQARRGPIRVHPLRGSCRGSRPCPSCRPTLDPRTPPGTTVGTDQAGLERQSRRPYRRIPDRRRARLSPRPYVLFCSSGQGTQRLGAKQPAVQPFSICDIAEPTHSALARTRKGNGRGITATVTSSNLGLRSVTSTG